GDGFERRPGDEDLAIAHPPFHTAGAIGAALDAAALPVDDLIVGLRAPAGGGGESVADLHPLDRLDTHEGARDARVEFPIPLHEGTEPRGQAIGEHFDDAAEGVAGLLRRVDLRDHRRGGFGVEAADRILVEGGDVLGGGFRGILGYGYRAHAVDVGDEFDPRGLFQQGRGYPTERDPARRLPRGGALV